jgi:hypothetical protein
MKHAAFYYPIGFVFFPFVVSCFDSFGPTEFAVSIFWLIWNCDSMRLFLFHQHLALTEQGDAVIVAEFNTLKD